jgi:hypothetical protein
VSRPFLPARTSSIADPTAETKLSANKSAAGRLPWHWACARTSGFMHIHWAATIILSGRIASPENVTPEWLSLAWPFPRNS